MRFSRPTLTILFLILSPFAVLGQVDKKPKERTEIKGVVIHYDKFRDRKVVFTKPIDIGLGTSGRGYIGNMVFAYIVDADKKVSPLVLAISPGGTGFGAAMARGLDSNIERVYLSPDADVIILIGEQKYKLGKVTKDFALNSSGEYKGMVMVEVPLEVFSAIAKAAEWEMAVGSLESKIVKRYMNHIREKFTTLQSQYLQDTSQNK